MTTSTACIKERCTHPDHDVTADPPAWCRVCGAEHSADPDGIARECLPREAVWDEGVPHREAP